MSHLLEKKEHSFTMFDKLAKRYDLANRILSFGLDPWWRKKAARQCNKDKPLAILDLATGTADQLIAYQKEGFTLDKAIGLDPSSQMLVLAKKKAPFAEFVNGCATQTGFPSDTFDLCSVSFGVRNFSQLEKSLQEIYRVLKKEGQLMILEFSTPKNRSVASLYFFHLKYIMPKLGHLITKNKEAYQYLDETIRNFPSGENFALLLRKAGFTDVQITPLTFGSVTIYTAKK